ncbi:hypothetical protein GGS26DRAFT_595455 [Hypomontagnella submonticulosa]|nr:hypothetical protein GGS26DRAFT_595455 [Hypomontagnella submonticulosa]
MGRTAIFTHDLESFFWVLLRLCTGGDYKGPGDDQGPDWDDTLFVEWQRLDFSELADAKAYMISDAADFVRSAELFTPFYEPVIPWMNKLHKIVFPGGEARSVQDTSLYDEMIKLLREASKSL